MTTSRPRVIVTRRLPEAVENALRSSFDVQLNPEDRQFTPMELREAMRHSDGLLCTLTDRLTPDLFAEPVSPCRILANFGVGVNHIALDAARRAGLTVTNTPGVLTECTADLTIALILMTMRRLGEGERELRAGAWTGWRPTHLLGRQVSGRTLGIVGFGRIGEAVARRASHGLGMRVLGWGPRPPAGERLAAAGASAAASLEDLLAASDIVSLHCPLAPETDRLMDHRRLHQMVRGAVLVNTARGEIVDEQALIAALRSGQLGGAGLDVYCREPEVPAALLTLPNVVLLPHLGSATVETRTAMGLRAVENLRAFFRGESPPDRIG
jgi:lactate dehydrogenase-like 2-hydroxyacid dehydrogenase